MNYEPDYGDKIDLTQEIIDLRKPYIKPQIKHEFDLEVRAGSPIPLQIDPLDFNNGE